jgi:hypothetical protein
MKQPLLSKSAVDQAIEDGYMRTYRELLELGTAFFSSHPFLTPAEQVSSAYSTLIYFSDEESFERSGQIQEIINEYIFGIIRYRRLLNSQKQL